MSPLVWFSLKVLAALVAIVMMAAAGDQTAHAASGIKVIGGAQAILNGSGMDQMVDVAVFEASDGQPYLLALGRNGIHTVNVADPLDPFRSGNITYDRFADSWSRDVEMFRAAEGRIYAAVTGYDFMILNVTDPANPEIVDGKPEGASRSSVFDDAYYVTVSERSDGRVLAIVTGYDDAQQAVDITDPYNPVVMEGGLDLDLPVAAEGDAAAFFESVKGGFGFDVRIRDVAIIESPDGRVHAAVADGQDVAILDISDPARQVQVSRIRDGEGGFDYVDTVRGMAVIKYPDGRAYLAMASDEGIQMADVTDPGAPAAAGGIRGIPITFRNPTVFEAGDGRTYALGVGGDAVSIVDITDPRLPVPLGSILDGEDNFDTLDDVKQVEVLQTPDGRAYAMATGWEGLQVIEVTDPHFPVAAGILRNGTGGFEAVGLISVATLQQPEEGRNYLLVADHSRGIHTVDVTDPRAPVLAGSLWGGEGGINLLGGIHDIDIFFDVADGHPYALVTGDWGIHTIDMANPAAPVVVGTIDGTVNGTIGGYSLAATYQSVVFGSVSGCIHALISDYMTGIHIIDLTDPHAPVHAGSLSARAEDGVEVIPGAAAITTTSPDGRVWALAIGWDDIQILEITDPHAPTLIGGILAGEGGLELERMPWDIIALEPDGGRVHALASGGDRLWILDMTYPLSPAVSRMDRWGWEGINLETLWADIEKDVYRIDRWGWEGIPEPDGGIPNGCAVESSGFIHPGSAGIIMPGPDDNIAIVESPDGRMYKVWTDPTGGLLAVDGACSHAAKSHNFRWPDTGKADWPLTVPGGPGPVSGATVELFKPHDGRTYMMIGGGDAIWVVDITYPYAPTLAGYIQDNLGGFYSLGGISDISTFTSPDGRVLALVSGDDGIQVIDITNPYSPGPTGSIHKIPGIPAYEGIRQTAVVPIPDGRVIALAVDEAGRAGMLDITDPRLPVPAGIIPSADGAGPILDITTHKTLDDHIHVLLTGEDTSRVIDITNPDGPVVVTVFDEDITYEESQAVSYEKDGVTIVTIRVESSRADGDGGYFPQTVTINVGDTVTWRNEDTTAHGISGMRDTDDRWGEAFYSFRQLLPCDEFSHRFEEAGRYRYGGFHHPWMVGWVVVVE